MASLWALISCWGLCDLETIYMKNFDFLLEALEDFVGILISLSLWDQI